MRAHSWVTRSVWGKASPYPVAYCSRCGLRVRRRLKDGRALRSGDRARMSNVEPLPVGPCQPTLLRRFSSVMGIVLVVAALVLSVVVSPFIFAGFVAAAIVLGVLQAGWRLLRKQP
jgi:Flp pilus assembly protein TadB